MKPAVFLLALANVVLYASLMPLWDGFDEPFHYGYVQTLAARRELPTVRSPMTQEVMRSIELAPASHVVKQNLPQVATFGDYHALPEAERRARRDALLRLDPALRGELDANAPNYQGQQAPLAYLLLAPLDHYWAARPLPDRIWRLRLVTGLAGMVLQLLMTLILARRLGLPRHAAAIALFLVASAQVLYATVARVSNDWLAVPLATALILALISFARQPRPLSGAVVGLVLAAGLASKAYFLAGAGLTLAVIAWTAVKGRARWTAAAPALLVPLLLAGPWYARNILLYGNLTGMFQSTRGVTLERTFQAALELPWPRAFISQARSALWTGNNSFLSFSSFTLDLMLALAAAGLLLWLASRKQPGDWLTAFSLLSYTAALAYAAALFWAYTANRTLTIAPWHAQVLGPAAACLVLKGFASRPALGRWLAAALVLIAAYVMIATYWVKLIPLYGGGPFSRTRPAALYHWYAGEITRGWTLLADTAMLGPTPLLALAALITAGYSLVAFALLRRLTRSGLA